MLEQTKRGPGRPEGSKKIDPDMERDIWFQVRGLQMLEQLEGRKRSIRSVCSILEGRGGIAWIVGGDRAAISSYMVRRRRETQRWVRLRSRRRLRSSQTLPASKGPIVATYRVTRTIRNHYVRANKLYNSNADVKALWDRMLAYMLPPARSN